MKINFVKVRAIVSMLLILLFVVVTFTGIGLYFAPSGRIARETNWLFFGINRFKLGNLHTITGFVMTALILLHFLVNYKMFFGEIKSLFEKIK